MLYKLKSVEGGFAEVERMPFRDFVTFGQREKDLEDLIARNLLDMLFEEAGLVPDRQERQGQQVADIYAVNATGELTIFELKRSTAGSAQPSRYRKPVSAEPDRAGNYTVLYACPDLTTAFIETIVRGRFTHRRKRNVALREFTERVRVRTSTD